MLPQNKKYALLLVLCFCCLACPLFAQTPDYLLKENSVWVFGREFPANGSFGKGVALNFNAGSPPSTTPVNTVGIGAATASVCDTAGKLLFYTNGIFVFDANGNVMSHGDSLVADNGLYSTEGLYTSGAITDPTTGNADGALITPVLGNKDQYYVFSLTSSDHWVDVASPNNQVSKGIFSELFYSIVDMSLNNGTGGIVTGTKGRLLGSNLGVGMTAIAGTHCDIWLVCMPLDSISTFRAYHITAAGIDTVGVVSHCNNLLNSEGSSLTVSPDRKKMVLTDLASGVEFMDFNNATGIVSKVHTIAKDSYFGSIVHSACFSPNNTKLYLSVTEPNLNDYIIQVDLNDTSFATYYAQANPNAASNIQLAPDGRLYMSQYNASTGTATGLACIQYPDSPGVECNLVTNYLPVYPGSAIGAGVHNLYVKAVVMQADTSHPDASFCRPGTAGLHLAGPAGYEHYLWNTDDTGVSILAYTTGLYILTSSNVCQTQVDSFRVREVDDQFSFGADAFYCTDSIALHLPFSATAQYLWQDGSAADSFVAHGSGTYAARITDDGCVYADTINLKLYDVYQNLGKDTTLCSNDRIISLPLVANAGPHAQVLWSNGEITPKLQAGPGTWWVAVTDGQCVGTDTVTITSQLCQCQPYIPNAFTPNGDGRNDEFRALFETGCPVNYYTLRVFNRWGTEVFSSTQPQQGWDGTYRHIAADLGNYSYELQFLLGTSPEVHRFKGDVTLVR